MRTGGGGAAIPHLADKIMSPNCLRRVARQAALTDTESIA